MISTVLLQLSMFIAHAIAGATPLAQQSVPTNTTGTAVKVRTIEPQRIAYRAHKGAYWTIGPVVREVRAYMAKHRLPGPLFIRYLNDPRRMGASLETQIGFVLSETHDPGPGFQTATRKSERVASMTIVGRSPAPNRDYAVVFEWVKKNGLLASGPVMELYAGDSSTASRSVEVQVALSGMRDAPPINPQAATSAEVQESNNNLASNKTVSSQSSNVAKETTPQVEQQREPPPTTAIAKVTSPLSEAPPQAEPKKAGSPLSDDESIENLIAAERFDQMARVLLPDDHAIDPALLPWIDDTFARLHAAARGIRRMYPSQGASMLKMADALTLRLKEVSSRAMQPSPRIGSLSYQEEIDQQSQCRNIIRELDVLLSRIALRSAKPPDAADSMKAALRQIDEVIHMGGATDKRPAP